MTTSLRSAPAGLLAAALLAGCTGGEEPGPTVATPSVAAPAGTMATAEAGDRLTLTAGGAAILTVDSFLVRDVDLPETGLLVLGDAPRGLRTSGSPASTSSVVVAFRVTSHG